MICSRIDAVSSRRRDALILAVILLALLHCLYIQCALAQGSAAFGNGLSAAATARGGTIVAEHGSAIDAVEGNPAGLAGIKTSLLDLNAVALVAGGSFENAVNANATPSGVAGALPYGAFAFPVGTTRRWAVSAAVTPEVLIRSNWRYNDAPGTDGVTYGDQRQESQIVAVRSSFGLARTWGTKWAAGVTLGVDYNQNDLSAPYIFQQQPSLAGLKVLLNMTTRGYGWNGGAGLQWQPVSRLRAGVTWKSETSIRTDGTASGSASALFAALKISADPAYTYRAQVLNHLPQAWGAGFRWQLTRRVAVGVEGDVTDWHQAFQELPVALSAGTNTTLNSVVGANSFKDLVPLKWKTQTVAHLGFERTLQGTFIVRGGYSYMSNPVPSATLTPLTAAILQNSIATGVGWSRGRMHCDLAYQVQLPAAQSVGQSGLLAGEYSNSRVRVWTRSVVVSWRLSFGRAYSLRGTLADDARPGGLYVQYE